MLFAHPCLILENYIFFPLLQLREEFKLKKGILKNYVKLVKESDYDENGTVTLNEWMAWITQRKQEYDRKNWLLKPWKSFIVIVSLIQFIIGVADRIEKYYRCYDYQFKGHSTCPFIRPFHDAMIFKSCLRFEAWRYVTHAFVHHGLPHLATNLGLQLFFGKKNSQTKIYLYLVMYIFFFF